MRESEAKRELGRMREGERYYTVPLHFQQFIKCARKLAHVSICTNTNTRTHSSVVVFVFVFVFVAKRGKTFCFKFVCSAQGEGEGVARNSIEILLK